jgi:4a-hydroxytetrahydrobiopterin dehydratase
VSKPDPARPAPLTRDEIAQALEALPEWHLSDGGTALTRVLTFKGFAKATYAANLAIWLADQSGHHPDIRLGWGYCHVSFTTHDIDGLSALDVDCAKRFDALLVG